MLEALREEVWRQHMELPNNNRATWTGSNVNGRDPEGWHVEGKYKPSSDTASHLYIYRQSRCPNSTRVPPPCMGRSNPPGTGK